MSYPAALREAAAAPRPEIVTSPVRHLGPSALRWDAHPEYVPFMRAVYLAHVARAARRRPFRGSLAPRDLAPVASGECLLRDAAQQAQSMLGAAHAALRQDQAAGDRLAGDTRSFWVSSAYRSASRQYRLWQRRFPGYFAQTQRQRERILAGPTSPEAARWLARWIGRWLAAPGFSNHNAGRAIDLACELTGHRTLTAKQEHIPHWQVCWLYCWLTANAARYSFYPYPPEPWHWEHCPGPGPCRPR
jgi:LAS superfamily LD-carboxypeptidase LdcB